MKKFSCIILRLVRVSQFSVRHNSFSVLKPFWDVDERLGVGRKHLEESVKLRGLRVQVSEIESCWTEYKDLVSRMNILTENRNEVSRRIEGCMKQDGDDEIAANLKHLKVTARLLRDDFKHLKSAIQNYENVIFPIIFEMPNDLHSSVSAEETVIFETDESLKKPKSRHHLAIATEQDLLEFESPSSYFLKNDAALFEIQAADRFKSHLEKSFNMISGPGFSRTLVVDGSQGSNHPFVLPLGKSTDEGDRLYLNGVASIYPFLSFLAKQTLQRDTLPWRYFTLGRHYCHMTQTQDLMSANQTDAIQVFSGSTRQTVDDEFDHLLNTVKDVYSSFALPFRITNVSAVDLFRAESRRVSFQVYSTYSRHFHEIGHLSLYGDYLSKRMTSKYAYDGAHFLQCISGTIVKITPFLACYLEFANDLKLI